MVELNTGKSGVVSLDLKKGMSLDLTKHDEDLKILKIGLGWTTRFDLDSIAFLTKENGKIEETVCYQHLHGNGVELDGDDTQGGKIGDCETLTVDFSRVPSSIKKIMLCANIYNARKTETKKTLFGKEKLIKGDTFSDVDGSYIRLYNAETNVELCKYSLQEDGSSYNAFHFADLIKGDDGRWSFQAVGIGMNGSISELRHQLDK